MKIKLSFPTRIFLSVIIISALLITSCSSFYKTNPFLLSFDYLEKENIEGRYGRLPGSAHDEIIITHIDSTKFKIKKTFFKSDGYLGYDSCYGNFNKGVMILDNSFTSNRNKEYSGNIWWFIKYGELTFFVINDDIKYVHILFSRGLESRSVRKYYRMDNKTFDLWNNQNSWKEYFEKEFNKER